MLEIPKNITAILEGEHKTALLYSVLAGAIVSDVVPTPASAFAYYKKQRLKAAETSGTIDGEAESKIGRAYYNALPIWWGTVFALIHFKKGGFDEKIKLAAILVGGGAVIGILFKRQLQLPDEKED